jgi:hypothetical protein
MLFSDTTNKNGAIQFCEEWLFGNDYGAISGNPTLLLKFTNGINRGLDKTKALIYQADARWQDDDPNFTDINDFTTNLSNGVATYRLDRDQLIVDGVEVMLADGNYKLLKHIDYADIKEKNIALSEYKSIAGIPEEYDIEGDILTLFPAPATGAVTMADGLKVLAKRPSSYFISTDTDVEMGIPRTFHDVPCLFACSEFASMNSMEQKMVDIENQLTLRKKDLTKHFSLRNKDEKRRLSIKQESNR